MKRTSVVILNWNGADHLRRFLPSVVAHTPAWAEVVVADNGSDDGSLALLGSEFPSVRVVRLDRNYGFAGGYNRALADLDADYAVLLNSDVETPEGWLEPLVETLDADPRRAAVAPKLLSYERPGDFEYAGASGGFIDYFGYPFCRGRILDSIERDEGQYDTPCDVFWASGAAFCCRVELFRAAGGFDETFFAHMEEIDLCWRLQLAGYRISVEPRSRVYHLGGGTLPNDTPRKLYLNYRNNLSMLLKCAPPAQRAAVCLVRPFMDGAAAFVYLLKGQWPQFRTVWRAYADFFRLHGALCRKRRAIRSAAVAESGCVYRGSIVARYLFGLRRFGRLMR